MKKLLPLLLGALLMGAGYFGYSKFVGGGGPTETPVQAQATAQKLLATEKKQRKKDKLAGPVISLGDAFIVNLADPATNSFVKFTASIKVDAGTPLEAAKSAAEEPALEEKTEARDIVLGVVGSKSSNDVKSAEGREALKSELIETLNAELPATLVLELYFTDFAIQA